MGQLYERLAESEKVKERFDMICVMKKMSFLSLRWLWSCCRPS